MFMYVNMNWFLLLCPCVILARLAATFFVRPLVLTGLHHVAPHTNTYSHNSAQFNRR